jgi:hypothetical protein
LANKTALFLLDYFHQVFQNINANTNTTNSKSKKQGKKKKKNIKYKLAVLNEEVEVTCLPTGYSTGFPPSPGHCDDCHKNLDESGGGTVLICGHGFHWHCYGKMEYACRHCEEYYKNGINKNVSSFLHRLEKGVDTFTDDDGIEEVEESQEDSEDNIEVKEDSQEKHKIVSNLQIALEYIDKW